MASGNVIEKCCFPEKMVSDTFVNFLYELSVILAKRCLIASRGRLVDPARGPSAISVGGSLLMTGWSGCHGLRYCPRMARLTGLPSWC